MRKRSRKRLELFLLKNIFNKAISALFSSRSVRTCSHHTVHKFLSLFLFFIANLIPFLVEDHEFLGLSIYNNDRFFCFSTLATLPVTKTTNRTDNSFLDIYFQLFFLLFSRVCLRKQVKRIRFQKVGRKKERLKRQCGL